MNTQSPLIDLLLAYNGMSQQQEIFKQQMLNFLSNPSCFLRSCSAGHFTASAFLLDKAQQQALLMYHRKLRQWVQLGGHADGDHDLLSVAIKEAQEESGIQAIVPVSTAIFDLDIHLIPENNFEPEHFHYDVRFLLKVVSDEAIQANAESLDLRWFTNDTSSLPTSAQSVTRLFTKWGAYAVNI